MNRRERELLFNVYLFAMLITCNIFFGFFVWNKHDLSPNFALALFTLIPAAILLIKIFKKEKLK